MDHKHILVGVHRCYVIMIFSGITLWSCKIKVAEWAFAFITLIIIMIAKGKHYII